MGVTALASIRNGLLEELEAFQNMLVAACQGDQIDPNHYSQMRSYLIGHPELKELTPKFLRTVRQSNEFWGFIKGISPKWAPRREFVREQLEPLITFVETRELGVIDQGVREVIERMDSDHVRTVWEKALARRASDSDGAITMSRTLLESVCKHILEDNGVEYSKKDDLPDLYYAVLKCLRFAPNDQTDTVMKQLFGGSQAVLEAIGALRNEVGDSHGKGKGHQAPSTPYAEFAVNLAGSIAMFILRLSEESTN